ncbi:PREDICTED: protein JTB [Calidris pugnax]|uniref:protein JTB n=1 Tax=Calidris pugnax TaxID=198806 RepID=UPI00071D7212|nr:PREDICTED: protein JTB [Calidris pugnax]
MGPWGPAGPRCCVLYAVLGALVCGLRPVGAAMVASDEKRSASPVATTPCWRVEDFVVTQECARCSGFEAVSALNPLLPVGTGSTGTGPGSRSRIPVPDPGPGS